jgi:ribosomal protein L30E
MSEINNIKKLIKENRIIYGTERTIKELKRGNIEIVYITKNVPKKVFDDIKYYSTLTKIKLIDLELSNQELGILCKKHYSISIIGVIKQGNE